MPRPDQPKFDLFARVFESIDGELDSLSRLYQFQLVKNQNRQPCRVLQKEGNPHFLVDISYEDYWFESEFRDDLLQRVTLIAYYIPPTNDMFVWRMDAVLATGVPFAQIQANIHAYLEQASLLIRAWTPERILNNGLRSKNLAKRYDQPSNID